MVFLRSCALSISNVVPYSYTGYKELYIGCKELEGSILVFHWGPFGLLYDSLYLTISVFAFTNSFSIFIVFIDLSETVSKFSSTFGWIINWFVVSISISFFLSNWFYKVVQLFVRLYSFYTLFQQIFLDLPNLLITLDY